MRRRRATARIAELQLALAAVGPEPTDAIGRWRHQEEIWGLQHELDRLLAARRPRRGPVAVEVTARLSPGGPRETPEKHETQERRYCTCVSSSACVNPRPAYTAIAGRLSDST